MIAIWLTAGFFSEQLLEMLNDDVTSTPLMTDDAHFHLSGYVKKQNYRYWAPENPQELHQRPLHSERFSGVGSHLLESLALNVFEDNEGATVTVTSERYVAMLRNFCELELRRRGIDLSSVWFQQDGATAHTTRASLSVLREIHYFHNTSFPVAAMFHGRHVRLISPPVITFYGGI